MSLAFISPTAVRQQTLETKSKALTSVDFSTVATAAAAPAAAAVAASGDYQSAAVVQAAISGVAGAQPALSGTGYAGVPYYSGTPFVGTSASPFASGGYGYGGVPSAGGYVGASVPGASVGAGVSTAGASQDYLEKQALFQQMNDANWEMLVAQVTVSELSRDYQARSNILKTKSDTELNAVRNMRA